MTNFCSNCGKKLTGVERFCPACGAAVVNTSDSAMENNHPEASTDPSNPEQFNVDSVARNTAQAAARGAANVSVAAKEVYKSLNLPSGDVRGASVVLDPIAGIWMLIAAILHGMMVFVQIIHRQSLLALIGIAAAVFYVILWQKKDWNWFYGIVAAAGVGGLLQLFQGMPVLAVAGGVGALITYYTSAPSFFQDVREKREVRKAERKVEMVGRPRRRLPILAAAISVIGAGVSAFYMFIEGSDMVLAYRAIVLLIDNRDVQTMRAVGYLLVVAAFAILVMEIVYLIQIFSGAGNANITSYIEGGTMVIASVIFVVLMLTIIANVKSMMDGFNSFVGQFGTDTSGLNYETNPFKILGNDIWFPITSTVAGIAMMILTPKSSVLNRNQASDSHQNPLN